MVVLYHDGSENQLTQGTSGSAGVDIALARDIVIEPNAVATMIDLEVRVQIVDFGLTSFLMVPRSSMSKLGLLLGNSVGIIDSDYTGTLKACVHNLKSTPVELKQGQRLFQVLQFSGLPIDNVRRVLKLPTWDAPGYDHRLVHNQMQQRGEGGFGSTGV